MFGVNDAIETNVFLFKHQRQHQRERPRWRSVWIGPYTGVSLIQYITYDTGSPPRIQPRKNRKNTSQMNEGENALRTP